MKVSLEGRLLNRELGQAPKQSEISGLYGDRTWINKLDIVNELDGHSGCVNALSWSRSGQLLASGSDDQHINVHSYQPTSSTAPFALTTTIATGHTANIFSVKFMPHSNDQTLVTAAGDGEVRVFDIEYAGSGGVASAAANVSSYRRRHGANNIFNGVRYLSDGNTNARVYRSHSDRVKRIVTESSPNLFLTCSEDGEVRQWDLRLPSSAYPPPRHRRMWRSPAADDSSDVPPPLISYKRFRLDLNSISCSPSQPQYIALGGSHLYCFLHDRRMIGRDKTLERGSPTSAVSSDQDDENMSQATRCVRRFAPNGQRRMKRTDNGHITACKISNANPNEVIASWSGEWIYSFDLVRTPDVRDQQGRASSVAESSQRNGNLKQARGKRKRQKTESTISEEGARRATSRKRTASHGTESEEAALRVRYENGQSEVFPIEPSHIRGPVSESQESVLSEAQKRAYRISKSVVKLRKDMCSLSQGEQPSTADPTGHTTSFTSVLGYGASVLPDVDEIMRTWRYPVDPDDVEVVLQQTLRKNRESARRYIQASGTLARSLGGKLRTGGSGESPAMQLFTEIIPAPNETQILDQRELFSYDFLRAILLWLDSGPGGMLRGFTRPTDRYTNSPRYPIPENASIDAVDEILITYLLELAGSRPICNVDASKFEVDENRITFKSEKSAVIAFAQAVKIPFEDLSRAIMPASAEGRATAYPNIAAQDRRAALRFWGLTVARSLLMNAGKGVDFAFVDRAFGGLGKADEVTRATERALRRAQEVIDPAEEDEVVESVGVVSRPKQAAEGDTVQRQMPVEEHASKPIGGSTMAESEMVNTNATDIPAAEEEEDEQMIPAQDIRETIMSADAATDSDDEDMDYDENQDNDTEDEDEAEEDNDEDGGPLRRQFILRSAFDRSQVREKVEQHVPCTSHLRQYRGHCNFKTVKDVNYFGLDDEYVVSGSDDGNLFIWDRKTARIVNILEGDGEVVNVVQAHPYEPTLAVSGIDHTIKIFSPDARARSNARHGIGVSAADSSAFSSLHFGRTRFRARRHSRQRQAGDRGSAGTAEASATSEPAVARTADDGAESGDEEKIAPNGLSSRKRLHLEYQITSQNDEKRLGGNREAVLTRSMLAQIAARLRARGANGGGGEGEEDGGEGVLEEVLGGQILINQDCTVM